MKAKETKYNGFNFRSRTEARWAVYFDSMGIKYYYEHEDITLPYHGRYLPDFYLPDMESYVEVKGVITQDEKDKCRELCEQTHKQVIMLVGVPDFKVFEYYYFDEFSNENFCKCGHCMDSGFLISDKCEGDWVKSNEPAVSTGVFCSKESKYGERIFTQPCIEDCYGFYDPQMWSQENEDAIMRARGARFETFHNN